MSIAQMIGRASTAIETSRRAGEFIAYAKHLMLDTNFARDPGVSPAVARIAKAAVPAMVTDPEGLVPYRQASEAFIAALSSVGAYDAIAADSIPGSLHARYGVATSLPAAAEHTEGAAKPVSRLVVTAVNVAERTAADIVALSAELLRFSPTADALLNRVLARAVATKTDAIFLDEMASVAAASIAATGQDAPGILADLSLAVASLALSSDSRLHLVVPTATAARLTFTAATDGSPAFSMSPAGGTIGTVPVHASDAISNSALLIDAAGLVTADGGLEVKAGAHASLEMDSEPSMAAAAGSPLAPAAATMVSMFASDSIALKTERRFGFVPIRDCAVELTGVVWGTSGSPPV